MANKKYERKGLAAKTANPRDLIPRPYSVAPPQDPPTIRVNPVRDIVVPLQFTASSVVTLGTINSGLEASGYTSGRFAIRYIHAWADGSASADLKIVDSGSSVACSDDGSFSQRARVGLNYPPVIQVTRAQADSATPICTIDVEPQGNIEVRVGVTWWGA